MINRTAFFDSVRSWAGRLTQGQVDGFTAIIDACENEGDLPAEHTAYILATAWHETGERMQPVRETFAASDDEAIRILDGAWARGKLPWVKAPYWRLDKIGHSWLGRGLVQITHYDNYAKADAMLKYRHGLRDHPDRALEMPVAVSILVQGMRTGLFTGKSLDDFAPGNYLGCRSIINGDGKKPVRKGSPLTMGQIIAGYARHFEQDLRA